MAGRSLAPGTTRGVDAAQSAPLSAAWHLARRRRCSWACARWTRSTTATRSTDPLFRHLPLRPHPPRPTTTISVSPHRPVHPHPALRVCAIAASTYTKCHGRSQTGSWLLSVQRHLDALVLAPVRERPSKKIRKPQCVCDDGGDILFHRQSCSRRDGSLTTWLKLLFINRLYRDPDKHHAKIPDGFAPKGRQRRLHGKLEAPLSIRRRSSIPNGEERPSSRRPSSRASS